MKFLGRQWPLSLLGWAATLMVCLAHFIHALTGTGPGRFPDLYVYRGAIEALRSGAGLYDFAAPNGDPFTYPPFAAVMLAPFVWLSAPVMEVVWFLLEVTALGGLAVLVARVRFPATQATSAPWIALALAVTAPVGSNIEFGQVSVFVLLAIAVAVLNVASGIPLGLAAAVKLLPVAGIPFLLAQGRRSSAALAAGVAVAATGVTWVFMPRDSMRYWLTELPSGTAYGDTSLLGNQSLLGVLQRTGLDGEVAKVAWLGGALALGIWAIVRARHWRNSKPFETLLVLAALVVVISPVSWTHHQLLLALAALVQVSRRRLVQMIWSGMVMLLMSVNLWNIPAPGPLGWVLANNRFLLALGLVAAIPWLVGRAAEPEHSRPHPGPRRRLAPYALMLGGVSIALAGCAGTPTISHPSETSVPPVHVLSQGSVSGKQWSFGYRTQNNQQCLLISIQGVEQQLGCDIPADDAIPINFGVVNDDDELTVVAGSVSDKTSKVRLLRDAQTAEEVTPIRVRPDRPRVFCLVTALQDRPRQLLALDAGGETIGTGGDKFSRAVTVTSGR